MQPRSCLMARCRDGRSLEQAKWTTPDPPLSWRPSLALQAALSVIALRPPRLARPRALPPAQTGIQAWPAG